MRAARVGVIKGTGLAVLFVVLTATSCAHNPPSVGGVRGASGSADRPWVPPRDALIPAKPADRPRETPTLPGALHVRADSLTLATILDLALRNSTQTRAAWAAARAAAAAYGSRRGDYLPEIGVGGFYARSETPKQDFDGTNLSRTYGPSADLSYLLFNFGGRKAGVDEARQALYAANWQHNATIQAVVRQVEEAYYQYLTAKALLVAQQATLDEAQANLDAARTRHDAGLGTIADVLQAQTAVSQTQLDLDGTQGLIATTRGTLATAMGLPANTDYDIELPQEELPIQEVSAMVEDLLATAQRQRPDLAAARAQAMQSRARLRKVKAEGYPAVTASGTLGRTFDDNPDIFADVYGASVRLRVPIFTGFSHLYDVRQASAESDLAQARYESAEQLVTLQVWTSYYDLKTAEARIRTSDDLLKSASESQDVALGRYRAGVGSFLDLLSAQAALSRARAQRVQARGDWYSAVANLAYATGTLGLSDKEGTQ
jgi:outer membrane protein